MRIKLLNAKNNSYNIPYLIKLYLHHNLFDIVCETRTPFLFSSFLLSFSNFGTARYQGRCNGVEQQQNKKKYNQMIELVLFVLFT